MCCGHVGGVVVEVARERGRVSLIRQKRRARGGHRQDRGADVELGHRLQRRIDAPVGDRPSAGLAQSGLLQGFSVVGWDHVVMGVDSQHNGAFDIEGRGPMTLRKTMTTHGKRPKGAVLCSVATGRRSRVPHGVALSAEVDGAVIRRGGHAGLHDVTVVQILCVFEGLPLEEGLPFHGRW